MMDARPAPGEPLFTALARSLPASIPFVGPDTLERRRGAAFKARLGANESVFGPSPRVVEAMARAAAGSWTYGDPEQYEIKSAIAAHHGVAKECVTVGEGIDGLLGTLVHLCVGPGDRVVTSSGGYPTFNYHVAAYGGALETVARDGDRQDAGALVARATELQAKLIYFANPDNPTGSWHEARDVERLIAETPETAILVLDEAYCDFAPASALPPIGATAPNVLRFRTFSKAYGMAGARIGYAIGHPESIRQFDKVRNHFGVSLMTQAGAVAALGDAAYLRSVVERVGTGRRRLAEIALAAGLAPLPSATNFVAIDCLRDGAYAAAVLEGVLDRGVFIRKPGVSPLDRLIRVTVGRSEDLDLFERVLNETLAELG